MFRPHVLACAGVVLFLTAALPAVSISATYYVDNQNPAATDAGPGTLDTPYRTISAAVTQRGGAGTTILVLPGTYPETVTVGASGASGNPFVIEAQGAVTLDASGKTYGFRLSGKSWVTIRGFTVRGCTDKGVYASSASNYFTIQNCLVTSCGTQGIYLSGSSNGLIDANEVSYNGDHGIYLASGTTASTVRRNYSHHNARPSVRAANGIQLNGSSGNRVEANRLGNNQDTGLQINTSSNNNLCLQNVSWGNGDHGYDHLSSTGNIHIGDVAYGNYKDGFSFEGNAPGGGVFNCIAINNGLTTAEFNLWVDSNSSVGFSSNDNIFWNSNGQSPIKYIATIYSSVASFSAATGLDTRSLQADPRFANAGAANFHLLAGSPAIDAANSSVAGWPAADAEGLARFDDPSTANSGTGPVLYADRGAHEYQTTTSGAPTAALVVNPSSGQAPLAVTANASGSSDPGGSIVSYRFDFGDGVVVGPQAGATANHTYSAGTWLATVTVTDNSGLTASASQSVTVSGVDQAPVVNAPASVSVSEGNLLTVNVTASDPDGNPIASLTADLSGLPAGSNAQFTPSLDNTTGTLTWTPSYTAAGTYTVTFRASNALTGQRTTSITVYNTDRAPVVQAPGTLRGTPGRQFTVNVTASDPDGDAISSLTVDASSVPAGNPWQFTVNATNTAGTFTWTPASGQTGNFNLIFRASNALVGSATTRLAVRKYGSASATETDTWTPTELALSPPLPNPSHGRVTFDLDLPDEAAVSWSVYDVRGRELWSEANRFGAGRHVLTWDGVDRRGGRAGAGLYFVRVRVGGQEFTRRFTRM